jgi:Integrase core domain
LLSDNHSSFTGRLYGFEVSFERRLAEVGVELINAAPAHPQTLGKLERFHRTLKEWLEDEGPAADLEHLQLLLDRFRTHYNQERPHQGIGNLTPVERYLPAPEQVTRLGDRRLAEAESSPEYPPYSLLRNVWRNGVVSYDGLAITLGKRYAGAAVRIVEVGELIHVYLGDELIRALAPDRTKRCQKLGKPERRRYEKTCRACPEYAVSHLTRERTDLNAKARFAGVLQSPLTDSNRRPPPYHPGPDAGSAGTAGSRSPRKRSTPKESDIEE